MANLQWRAGQSSGQTRIKGVSWRLKRGLQWRAGQSSGQTWRTGSVNGSPLPPSMEGRTIVRPDTTQWRQRSLMPSTFNGGPDNRPARQAVSDGAASHVLRLQWRAGQSSGQTYHVAVTTNTLLKPFNGGPDNRPARLRSKLCLFRVVFGLQWRAGQSSGQTGGNTANVKGYVVPSMGGPDNRPARRPVHRFTELRIDPFNGGPDNRPARPARAFKVQIEESVLQWRAGQSSGQTGYTDAIAGALDFPSMEGRTIVRPRLSLLCGVVCRCFPPSMEGRTIVRPDCK